MQSQQGRDVRRELGQFFTPSSVAEFMASLFAAPGREVRLLDAGAGTGALTSAIVRHCAAAASKPISIDVTAFEIDPHAAARLPEAFDDCQRICEKSEIRFRAVLLCEDFIERATAELSGGLLHRRSLPVFNAAIVNPPYRKLRSDSESRRLLSSIGIEASNLYTAFMALIVKLLEPRAELVSITPRSFCNGPYFKPFRRQFLREMSLRRLHVFESRSEVFGRDEVLQENVIVHAVKESTRPMTVTVSSSNGIEDANRQLRNVPYSQVVSPSDPEQFIHLVGEERVRLTMSGLPSSLEDLGLSVSTGRVVDFRAREHLRQDPSTGTVPLIYPCHFNGDLVHWPKAKSRKPNAIRRNADTEDLLVPAEVFVLTKRFSAKEERRRVVACVFDPKYFESEVVGFENHLNYFHCQGRGLPATLARGLSAFLNSSLVDNFFRQFNGHTQVNATDLRSLRYPSREALQHLGKKVQHWPADQRTLDEIVEEVLRVES